MHFIRETVLVSVSLFNDISTFLGDLMPKPFSSKSVRVFLSNSCANEQVHISSNVNKMARLDFEPTY